MIESIIDKEYGLLQFVEGFDGRKFWSGKTKFKNTETLLFFEAGNNCPSQIQRDALMKIDYFYKELVSTVYNVLPNELKKNTQLAESNYFMGIFKPKSISIATEGLENSNWNITLQSMENQRHFLSVEFKGFVAEKSFLEK